MLDDHWQCDCNSRKFENQIVVRLKVTIKSIMHGENFLFIQVWIQDTEQSKVERNGNGLKCNNSNNRSDALILCLGQTTEL